MDLRAGRSPSSFQYRVSASSGTVNYSIRNRSWLTVSSSFGVTDVGGVTISFTVNSTASQLALGKDGPGVAFTNVTNGQGSAARPATLISNARSPCAPRRTPAVIRVHRHWSSSIQYPKKIPTIER